jgi:hypothetical protein
MKSVLNIEFLIISFVFGLMVNNITSRIILKFKNKKIIKDLNDQFNQVLSNLNTNKAKFVNRINQAVYFKTKLKDYGSVEIIYMIDKKDIVIFKKDKCLFSSQIADKETISSIVDLIEKKYNTKINDIVNILGNIYSREFFEKKFNVKVDNNMTIHNLNEPESDISKLTKGKGPKFNMDDILDKINKVGIVNLTEEEKKFLSDFNK